MFRLANQAQSSAYAALVSAEDGQQREAQILGALPLPRRVEPRQQTTKPQDRQFQEAHDSQIRMGPFLQDLPQDAETIQGRPCWSRFCHIAITKQDARSWCLRGPTFNGLSQDRCTSRHFCFLLRGLPVVLPCKCEIRNWRKSIRQL